MGSLHDDAVAIFRSGVLAADAGRLVANAVRVDGRGLVAGDRRISLDPGVRVAVVGAGKASGAMAQALESALGRRFLADHEVTGWVNVPDAASRALRRIVLHPARRSHRNLPTPGALAGSERMLDLVAGLEPRDLAVVLLSGGGSALWPAPAPGLTLRDKERTTGLLLAAGAGIEEMNAVRKHLSRVKGGGLVRATRSRLLTLVISDVVGDPLHAIASGPTAPDPTTYAGALGILERYRLAGRVPARVLDHLRRGARGRVPETLKRPSRRVVHVILGSNATARLGASRTARELGYAVRDLGSRWEGESRQVGTTLAGMVHTAAASRSPAGPPLCLIAGGETTVTLGRRPGKGGRNQELVLAALVHLGAEELADVAILSGGTDGEDGPTDAAGGIVTAAVARAARRRGLDPARALARHDSYPFLEATGGLLRTGPTRTNVMDLMVALIRPARARGRGRAARPRRRA
jgi:glycerate 2-kinase